MEFFFLSDVSPGVKPSVYTSSWKVNLRKYDSAVPPSVCVIGITLKTHSFESTQEENITGGMENIYFNGSKLNTVFSAVAPHTHTYTLAVRLSCCQCACCKACTILAQQTKLRVSMCVCVSHLHQLLQKISSSKKHLKANSTTSINTNECRSAI